MNCRRFFAVVQILLLTCGGLWAQSSPAEKARQDVGKIGLQGNITVYMPNGQEYYGSVSQIGAKTNLKSAGPRRVLPFHLKSTSTIRSKLKV